MNHDSGSLAMIQGSGALLSYSSSLSSRDWGPKYNPVIAVYNIVLIKKLWMAIIIDINSSFEHFYKRIAGLGWN